MTIAAVQEEARPRDLPALGAALVTVVFWASAFVRDPLGRQELRTGRALARTAARRRGGTRRRAPRAGRAPAAAGRAARGRRPAAPVRAVVVRRVQRRVELGRASRRCRHGRDARQHRADSDRGRRRRRPARRLSAHALHGRRGRVRRRGGDRGRELEPFRDDNRRPPLLRRRRGICRRRRGAEGRAAPDPAAADDLPVLPDRHCRLLALRAAARARARNRTRNGDRVDRVPRPVPDRARVRHLGVRAVANRRRPPRGDDVPRPADLRPARVAASERDSRIARVSRRGALPRRRRALAARARRSCAAGRRAGGAAGTGSAP